MGAPFYRGGDESRGQTPLKAFVNARWGRSFCEFNPHRTRQTHALTHTHSHSYTLTYTYTHSLTHSLCQDSLPGKRGSTHCDSTLCCKLHATQRVGVDFDTRKLQLKNCGYVTRFYGYISRAPVCKPLRPQLLNHSFCPALPCTGHRNRIPLGAGVHSSCCSLTTISHLGESARH